MKPNLRIVGADRSAQAAKGEKLGPQPQADTLSITLSAAQVEELARVLRRASEEIRAAEARAVEAEQRALQAAEKAVATARRANERVALVEAQCTSLRQQLETSATRLSEAEVMCANVFSELLKATKP